MVWGIGLMKNKIKKIDKLLMKNFILFSVLIVIIFQITTMISKGIWSDYMIQIVGEYFASQIVNSDYKKIDTNRIEKIGGWVYILNDDFEVIYIKGKENNKNLFLTATDIAQLINGKYVENQKEIYASFQDFIGLDGERYICLVCIPANNVEITSTILNVSDVGIEFMGIVLITIFLFICGYWATIVILAKQIDSKITKPIYAITEALNRVRNGEYHTKLELKANNEFLYIKDSFNYMIRELDQLKIENKKEIDKRTRLLSDIGHDLKTPITIIQGYLGAIINGDIQDNQKKEAYLKLSLSNTIHLSELIELLLNYSKFDMEEYKINIQKIELTEFVREIVADYYQVIENSGMYINVEIPADSIYAEVDELEISRLIKNLLNNGIQHNEIGTSIYIGIRREETISLIIADNGKAISEELKASIFEPFVCGELSRNDTKRNGLGLAIVYKIVQKHHGTIKIIDLWEGYTKAFIIELPNKY